eukprot:11177131-Lingulodinium_polyedra.AAC.1
MSASRKRAPTANRRLTSVNNQSAGARILNVAGNAAAHACSRKPDGRACLEVRTLHTRTVGW